MILPALYQIFLGCSAVTTDSRNCPPNSLFIALKGESFNGNAFAAQALRAGCSYAVIDEPAYQEEGNERFILVPDALLALQQLANYHRRQLGIPVIGITGTNGKTTTKELISAVLSQRYQVLCTAGNLNNHIGVPLTLLRLKPTDTLAVIEMGANHPGEIKMLAEIVEPDYGLITNVGRAHLEGFGSFEGVIQTKGELYDYLSKRANAAVFVHRDNADLMKMVESRQLSPLFYGSDSSLYISGEITGNSPFLNFVWSSCQGNETHKVTTQLIGEYNFANALAAVTIGHYFEVEPLLINAALSAYAPQNNRSQLKKTANNTLIIDAYNANPTSMMAALENFRKMEAPNKMLLLGEMRELGAESEAEHKKIVDFLEREPFATVRLVGEAFAAVGHHFTCYPNAAALIDALQKEKPQQQTILIKGSNGIQLHTVIDYL